MSGTKRVPLHRRRVPPVAPDALALFAQLEQTPRRQRSDRAFKDGEHELARRLNLIDEFWRGSSVLDRDSVPCHPAGYLAHRDWYRVRAVRTALLRAAAT
jgi:hypothetical protein